MKLHGRSLVKRAIFTLLSLAVILAMENSPALADEYDNALHEVEGIKVVFDVSQGEPDLANIIFWAVQDLYKAKATKSLANETQVAIVFHGPAVRLISTDFSLFEEGYYDEIDKFQDMIWELSNDGVKIEVCLYAAKVMGVDPATILPEIDQVGNGFISVAGYQAQGYAVIRVP